MRNSNIENFLTRALKARVEDDRLDEILHKVDTSFIYMIKKAAGFSLLLLIELVSKYFAQSKSPSLSKDKCALADCPPNAPSRGHTLCATVNKHISREGRRDSVRKKECDLMPSIFMM